MSPIDWKPTTTRLEEEIAAEQAKLDAALEKRKWQPEAPAFTQQTIAPAFSEQTIAPSWMPTQQGEIDPLTEEEKRVSGYQPPQLPGTLAQRQRQPSAIATAPPPLPRPQPAVGVTRKQVEEPIFVPPWQRALQIFSAPFNWIDENIIIPGEALVGTGLGITPEVKREAGEDYWQWKKRSWAAWETPGVNINVPWSDEPWRIDVKGVLAFAPWLLIPGAGQVGTGAKAGIGIAGGLAKLGRVGRVVGRAVEYSPWGLAEKTAGVAIKGGFRAVGAVSERMSTAVGEKLYGKYTPPPVPASVTKLTGYMEEAGMPAYRAFQKALPQELRARQRAAVSEVQRQYKRGEFSLTPNALSDISGYMFSGSASREAQSNWFSGSIDKALDFAKARLKSGRGGEPVIRVYRIGDIEFRGANKIIDLMESSGKQIPSSEYSMMYLKDIEPAYTIRLLKGFRTTKEDIMAQLKASVPASELLQREAQALKEVGGIKEFYALTPEKLAIRQAKEIEDISNAIANDKISEQVGKGLITRIKNSPAYKAVQFTDAEGKELNDMLLRAFEDGVASFETRQAFTDFIFKGIVPEAHNLRDWIPVFGRDFANAVGKLDRSRANTIIDTLGIGKSVISSMDLSATLRQGLILGLLHPTKVPIWFGRQVKALLSEKWALEIDDVMRANPVFQKWERRGAYFAPITEATARTAEEAFPSRFAERIPGIKRSGRAFNTYVNQARLATLEQAEAAMVAQGATEAQLRLFADFVNSASGRGKAPVKLENYMPALNAVFFSPRLQLATLQLPRQIGRMLISDNPYMRKQGALALATFVGGGVSLLGLLHMTGVSKIERDPRSGDFAKIKIGDTRLDIWRGYVQYARFGAQLLSGERKSAYGNMNKAERSEIASRFLQSKSSPVIGLLADVLRGETYEGKPIFNDTTGFSKAAQQRIIPLAVQDIVDAMEMNGINGLWTAAPATLGIGALTYVNDFVKVKEKIAGEMGYKSWDDIDPKTQRQIENRNAELQAATIAFDRQVMGTAWGDWRLVGKAIDDVFRQNVDNAISKYRQSGDGVQFRKDISKAWTERRGAYKTREKEARFEDIVKRLNLPRTEEQLLALGPEQLAIKTYNDALFGDEMFDEFGDYRFDEADKRKEMLKQSMSPELFQYIEDYQELKWETFPPEFLELMEAKKLMKPYWAVADTVARLFGQRFADSTAGERLIASRRKQMRMKNPQLERVYLMFYTQ